MLPNLLDLFPPHRVFVDLFGGSGCVLYAKPRSRYEIYNDLDHHLVNFFRVIRSDRAGELIDLVNQTPWSREEFELAVSQKLDVHTLDPVQWAWNFLVLTVMGHSGNAGIENATPGQMRTTQNDWIGLPARIRLMAERFKKVYVENQDFSKIISRWDSPTTLFYADPPYLGINRYNVGMDRKDHVRLLKQLHQVQGLVVLSGYASPLYDMWLGGWSRSSTPVRTNRATLRTEVVWSNPAATVALPPTLL